MKKLTSFIYSGGSIYIIGILGADAINFFFNAFLGRFLTFSDFGVITLINALSYIGSIILGSLSTTITHRISYLTARKATDKANTFFYKTRTAVLQINVIYILLWILCIVPISHFFKVTGYFPILFFLPVIPCGFITSMHRGYLTGKLFLKSVGMITFLEAMIKCLVAVVLVYGKLSSYAYIAVPISAIAVAIISFFIVKRSLPSQSQAQVPMKFPKKFFFASLSTGFATSAFLALDVLVAKHFLSPVNAGKYAFLTLMGKIIYFCGSLLITLIIAFVSREEGTDDIKNNTVLLLVASFLLTSIPYVIVGWFGKWVLPPFFGNKIYSILPYLSQYALAIALFTISIQIVSYYLAKKRYIFSSITLFCYFIMIGSIMIFHQTVWDIVHVILSISILEFIAILSLHIYEKYMYQSKNIHYA